MLVEVFVEADFIADLGFVDVQLGVFDMRALSSHEVTYLALEESRPLYSSIARWATMSITFGWSVLTAMLETASPTHIHGDLYHMTCNAGRTLL